MVLFYRLIHTVTLLLFTHQVFCSTVKTEALVSYANEHFKQIEVFDQIAYEFAPKADELKPPILKGQRGLCGIMALYNGICLMEALNIATEDPLFWFKKMMHIDCFHEWIQNNQEILTTIKNKHKNRLGSLRKKTIRKIAGAALDETKAQAVHSLDYFDILQDIIFWKHTSFSHFFRRHTKQPHLIVFNFDHHFIAVVFTEKTTWILDSLNVNRTLDYRVRQLDNFMRSNHYNPHKTFSPNDTPLDQLNLLPSAA